jgi:hypothetical protein
MLLAADRIKALTTPHRIKPTSTSRHSAWRPNPGRRSTYQPGESVQTTGTSSASGNPFIGNAGMSIGNVAPGNGFVDVHGSVDYGTNLNYRITVSIV